MSGCLALVDSLDDWLTGVFGARVAGFLAGWIPGWLAFRRLGLWLAVVDVFSLSGRLPNLTVLAH